MKKKSEWENERKKNESDRMKENGTPKRKKQKLWERKYKNSEIVSQRKKTKAKIYQNANRKYPS